MIDKSNPLDIALLARTRPKKFRFYMMSGRTAEALVTEAQLDEMRQVTGWVKIETPSGAVRLNMQLCESVVELSDEVILRDSLTRAPRR